MASMTDHPSIAVIIPTYNCEKYILEALASLERQTMLPHEVIVINDGSQDQTATLVADFSNDSKLNVTLINQSNRGIAAARNEGVRQVTSEFIAFLDGDDYFYPDFLEKTMAALISHPEFVLCFSDRHVIDEHGHLLRLDLDEPKFRKIAARRNADGSSTLIGNPLIPLASGNVIPIGNLVLRKTAFQRAGGFDSELRFVEDRPFLMRLSKDGVFGFIDEPLGIWRRYGNNVSGPGNAFKMNWYADFGLGKLQKDSDCLGLSPEEKEAVTRERALLSSRLLYSASSETRFSIYPVLALTLYREGRASFVTLAKCSVRYLWYRFLCIFRKAIPVGHK